MNSSQLKFDFIVLPDYLPQDNTPQRWWKFHSTNEHVFSFLDREAHHVWSEDIGQVSMQYLFVRFRLFGARTTGNPYKISNSFSPFYARLLCMVRPHLKDSLLVLHALSAKNSDSSQELLPAIKNYASTYPALI